MAKFYNPKLSVSSGEITPLLAARTDLAAYKNGAKTLTNGFVLPQGGFCNRPGAAYVSSVTTAMRIIPFIVNTDIAYILVFESTGSIQVYDKDGPVAFVTGVHSFVDMDDIFNSDKYIKDMTYVQSADIMLCFQKNCKPQIIKRLSHTSWTVDDFEFKFGPYQNMNTDNTITVLLSLWNSTEGYWKIASSSAVRDDGVTPFFSTDDIGSPFYFEFYASAFSALLDVADGGEWVRSPLYGNISMTTEGAWQGILTLSRRGESELDYSVISSFTAGTMVNNTYPVWAYTGTEDEIGASYKINAIVTSPASGYTGVRIRIEASGGIASYNFNITHVTDAQTAFVQVDNPEVNERIYAPIIGVSTFAFGSFGKARGYPGVCTFHQERLVLANSVAEPTTMWMSKPASWDNFDTTIPTEDSDSIQVVLATNQVNEIRAMTSKEDLLIFTAGAEFVAQTGSASDVFTPSSVVIVPTGYRGSAFLEVLNVGPSTLFAQKHRNVIRALGYKLDTDGYDTSELSVLSNHLFEGKQIVRWAYQQDPWSIVWIVLDDGTCLAFTYIQEHQVNGWTKHVFPWKVADICCIPGDGQDEVFLLQSDKNEDGFADGVLYKLNHREDRDGLWTASTYRDYGASPAPVMTFESMEMEQEQAQGTVQGRFKKISRVCMRLFRTAGLKSGIMTENSDKIDQVVFPGDEDTAPKYMPAGTSYTGDAFVNLPGDKGRHGRIKIVNDNASPITVLGVWEEVNMEDDA